MIPVNVPGAFARVRRAAGRWDRVLPTTSLSRQLSLQSLLYSSGTGVFLTGSAVFFTRVVGLRPAQVGLGLTLAGLARLVLAVPLGKLVDRYGFQSMWTAGALGAALFYCGWPLIDTFPAFLVVIVGLEVCNCVGWSGRGAYTLAILPRDDRVVAQAYMRAALNIGMTLGALVGGLALALGSGAIQAMPLFTGVVLAMTALFIHRMPRVPRSSAVPAPIRETLRGTRFRLGAALRSLGSLFSHRAFVLLSVCVGVLSTNQVLLNVVVPLWLVSETDAPGVLLAWLFGTNTVLAVALQVPVARRVDSVARSVTAARLSAALFTVACALALTSESSAGVWTILLIWLTIVAVTGSELYGSAAHWGFLTDLSDPDRLGEYQGAGQLGTGVGYVWTPAAFTFLAIEWGAAGWALIAGLVLVASAVVGPCARRAERSLASDTRPKAAAMS